MAFSRITNHWQMFWHFKDGNITWWKRSFKIRYLAFHLVERGPPHMIQEISLSYYQCDPQTSYHPHALWAPPVHLYAQIFTHYWHQLDKLQKSSFLQVFNEFLNSRSISMVCTKKCWLMNFTERLHRYRNYSNGSRRKWLWSDFVLDLPFKDVTVLLGTICN